MLPTNVTCKQNFFLCYKITIDFTACKHVEETGLEPVTSRLQGERSTS